MTEDDAIAKSRSVLVHCSDVDLRGSFETEERYAPLTSESKTMTPWGRNTMFYERIDFEVFSLYLFTTENKVAIMTGR